MRHRAVLTAAGLAVQGLVVACLLGCGVTSQDEPQPIEDRSIHQTPDTPSVATGPATTSPTKPPPTTSPPPTTTPPTSVATTTGRPT